MCNSNLSILLRFTTIDKYFWWNIIFMNNNRQVSITSFEKVSKATFQYIMMHFMFRGP